MMTMLKMMVIQFWDEAVRNHCFIRTHKQVAHVLSSVSQQHTLWPETGLHVRTWISGIYEITVTSRSRILLNTCNTIFKGNRRKETVTSVWGLVVESKLINRSRNDKKSTDWMNGRWTLIGVMLSICSRAHIYHLELNRTELNCLCFCLFSVVSSIM